MKLDNIEWLFFDVVSMEGGIFHYFHDIEELKRSLDTEE